MNFDSATISPAEVNQNVVDQLVELNLLKKGDKAILTKGDYVNVNGGTNTLKIVEVGGAIH